MQDPQVIEADWTWTGQCFEHGIQVVIEPDGFIHHVGPLDQKPTQRLLHRALLPGMVNAHSHAFQRGLRGRGETFPEKTGSFWTWRESMYELVSSLKADTFATICRQAFGEMLAAGITTVGEFHYLHHADPAAADFSFDELILEAAQEVGIRIVLLNTFYAAGGIGRPVGGAQQRFATPSLDVYWRQMDRVTPLLDRRSAHLGAAAHSIRAVTPEDMKRLCEEANRRGMVLHVHVEEQRREIDECVGAYGRTPMALLLDGLDLNDRFTAVHCTHTDANDLKRFVEAGGNVCICPLTEANLGDGIADLPGLRAAGGTVCLGTDSNARISMTEELRWLEYVQRLYHERRGVCIDDEGGAARALWQAATENGARSLGIHAGRIEPGYLADLIALDLSSPALCGWSPATLLDAFIFGAGNEAVADVCVAGRWTHPHGQSTPPLH